jgi:hypothetical protein
MHREQQLFYSEILQVIISEPLEIVIHTKGISMLLDDLSIQEKPQNRQLSENAAKKSVFISIMSPMSVHLQVNMSDVKL